MEPGQTFDEAYYARYYENPRTRIYSADDHSALAEYVFAFARWNQLPVDQVLDIGAGIGLWKQWILKHSPKSKYQGTEVSAAMCERHGYKQCSIASWRDRKRYDLIICQGVLQYINDEDLPLAIANIAAMARGLVYFEALTRKDYADRADQEKTDGNVFLRSGQTYRSLFGKHFVAVGAGLHWPKTLELPFWELDVAGAR
jgi:2-polyprenyl-3-methyl-5-hydroxy-6-metoxy-1,4-benzoquinol methylase